MSSLNWFIRYHIANDDTNFIISQVLSKLGKTASAWPGISVPLSTGKHASRRLSDLLNLTRCTSDNGKALLGTPNGAGVAFFLGQHTSALDGRYAVTSVVIFTTVVSGTTYNNLGFKLGYYGAV